jgi:hypothetical protein
MEYTTAGPADPGPAVGADVVLPSGGQFYPASRYAAAIDSESALRRLDRPLGTCDDDQYLPDPRGDMFNSRLLVPSGGSSRRGGGGQAASSMVDEMAMPRALLRSGEGGYECREADNRLLSGLSTLPFNNATKQDKYKLMSTPEVYGGRREA